MTVAMPSYPSENKPILEYIGVFMQHKWLVDLDPREGWYYSLWEMHEFMRPYVLKMIRLERV